MYDHKTCSHKYRAARQKKLLERNIHDAQLHLERETQRRSYRGTFRQSTVIKVRHSVWALSLNPRLAAFLQLTKHALVITSAVGMGPSPMWQSNTNYN